MKITDRRIKQIVKEEVQRALKEASWLEQEFGSKEPSAIWQDPITARRMHRSPGGGFARELSDAERAAHRGEGGDPGHMGAVSAVIEVEGQYERAVNDFYVYCKAAMAAPEHWKENAYKKLQSRYQKVKKILKGAQAAGIKVQEADPGDLLAAIAKQFDDCQKGSAPGAGPGPVASKKRRRRRTCKPRSRSFKRGCKPLEAEYGRNESCKWLYDHFYNEVDKANLNKVLGRKDYCWGRKHNDAMQFLKGETEEEGPAELPAIAHIDMLRMANGDAPRDPALRKLGRKVQTRGLSGTGRSNIRRIWKATDPELAQKVRDSQQSGLGSGQSDL